MVNRNKTDKGISKLPDVLICDKILSRLPTKDAVRTSALSTKWRNHWQLVPALDLDSRAFSCLDAFVNFGDRFFDSHRESSWLTKLKLRIHDHSDDGTIKSHHLSSWIDAVTKRKIQQLEVCFAKPSVIFNNVIPMSIYTCETLVQLPLYRVVLGNAEVVSLPCLKMMYLEDVYSLDYETIVEKLISGSPVLEELTIIGSLSGGKENVIQVRSQTLKRIHICMCTEVVIDAPLLQYFKTFIFNEKKNFKIVSTRLPAKLDIQVFSTKFDISEILTDISKARDLAICRYISKEIFLCMKSGPLLQLRYLSRLNASYYISDLELLPTLLESCPNLQYLKLVKEVSFLQTEEKETSVMFSRVLQCLVSSLKFVILKRTGSISECEGEMELVRYLLKNSRILEKLTLLFFTRNARSAILSMPRCSTACQIF